MILNSAFSRDTVQCQLNGFKIEMDMDIYIKWVLKKEGLPKIFWLLPSSPLLFLVRNCFDYE
jgi:hypothetical protein